ncbi:sialate O-acetylesterase [Pedobacter panaciterrae]|jgi:Domain of unknown function (DUF303).|uniref:sialate O-acetylesterase n=1 Tax=Pedobacter panaciterrae TaxID=363849 RepID=UPI00155DD518|nr:sialate O-acetylesterase [Pedobacter panaciterrae]NQX56984.1 sialate O-acetylesterase [Pedobacter panaciterrae]
MKNKFTSKRTKILSLLACVMIFSGFSSFGNIRLPAIIGNNMLLQQKMDVKLWGWADPNEKISITTSWNQKSYQVVGDRDAKWQITVPGSGAGGPYTIVFKGKNLITLTNILIGEVWVCSGQSNMEMCGNWGLKDIKEELPQAYNKNIRFFCIPKKSARYPQDDVEGSWEVCDSSALKTFSAVGYFFGKKLNEKLGTPIGLIGASWGGSAAEVWTPDSLVNADTALKSAASRIQPSGMVPYHPGYAYNAMIAPITNYSIAGAIWYQGENNTETANTYSKLFITLIDAWRKAWQKDFPFYYVQIAPFSYKKVNSGALLREAQLQSMSHPNTGMVATTDLVTDVNNVHPENKHDVGWRLANWALAETYGHKIHAYKSPVYTHVSFEKNKALITIANASAGMVIKGEKVNDIEIAGKDSIFYAAMATLKDNKIIAWSDSVKHPVALRYAFHDTSIGNVFNKDGLPLIPFRTDNWPIVTP